MAHISIEEGLPGILGPMKFRPETTVPLRKLAEVLLRDENTLTSAERETIAAFVSSGTAVDSASSPIAPQPPSTWAEMTPTTRFSNP
jgi:hypothetical protein